MVFTLSLFAQAFLEPTDLSSLCKCFPFANPDDIERLRDAFIKMDKDGSNGLFSLLDTGVLYSHFPCCNHLFFKCEKISFHLQKHVTIHDKRVGSFLIYNVHSLGIEIGELQYYMAASGRTFSIHVRVALSQTYLSPCFICSFYLLLEHSQLTSYIPNLPDLMGHDGRY